MDDVCLSISVYEGYIIYSETKIDGGEKRRRWEQHNTSLTKTKRAVCKAPNENEQYNTVTVPKTKEEHVH